MDTTLLVEGAAQSLGGVGMLLTLYALRHWIVVHYLKRDHAMSGARSRAEFSPRIDRAIVYAGPLMLLVAAVLLSTG